MKNAVYFPLIMLLLAIIACTTSIQQQAEAAAQQAAEQAVEEAENAIMQAIQEQVDNFTSYVGEVIEPYVPQGLINSIRWLYDEEVIEPSIVDPALSSLSGMADVLELYTGRATAQSIPVANLAWSGFSLINSGTRCLEQHESVLELEGKDCVDASLSLASGALAVAALVGAGTAAGPVIMGLGAGIAGLQILSNFVKWE